MSDCSLLLVEADIVVRRALAEYLRECGYRVLEVIDGNEARLVLAESNLSIDVVLASLDVPERGFDLVTWIRKNHPGIDIVTAGTVTNVVKRAGEICEDGPAIAKPYNHQHVLDRIRRLTAARRR